MYVTYRRMKILLFRSLYLILFMLRTGIKVNLSHNSPLPKLQETGTSEGLWDRLGRRNEIMPINLCISWKKVENY